MTRATAGRRRARATWPALLAALALGCGPERPANVVIIAIDTLRADRLGCYGYQRPTSPRLDALAERSMLFEDAIAQSSWTLPSFASILTGVLPQRHGAGQGKHCLQAACGALSAEQTLLAEPFLAAGYRTGSFVSNGFAGKASGLGRGFEETAGLMFGDRAVAALIAWMEQHRDEPLFAFVHIVEPHSPFGPPLPDAPSFVDPGYDGPLGSYADGPALQAVTTDADRRRVSDLYDADVWHADALAGKVLDALVRLDIDERTLIVVVADHGEELYERGTVGHGHTLFDEVLRVPLIIRYPGGTPRGRIAQQVRAMDVFPTVLEAVGLPVPTDLDAVSLNGFARGTGAPKETLEGVSEFTFSGPELRSYRNGHEKLVVDVVANGNRLFDLDTDPAETADVAGGRPERVAELRERLAASDRNAEPGLYVWLRGGAKAAPDQRARLAIRSPVAAFGAVEILSGEPGDTGTVLPDGTAMTIDVGIDAGDTDGVRVAIRDAVAALTVVRADVGGQPILGVGFRIGGKRQVVRAIPEETSMPALGVPRATAPTFRSDMPTIVVEAVLPRVRETLRFDPETAERLRALGYAE